MGADLGTNARADIFSNFFPVLVVKFDRFQKALVFFLGPPALGFALLLRGGRLLVLGEGATLGAHLLLFFLAASC